MSLFPHNLPETHSSGFPIISSKFRHKGVVKGVGGAWIGVEPIGGHTKGGATGAYVGWVGVCVCVYGGEVYCIALKWRVLVQGMFKGGGHPLVLHCTGLEARGKEGSSRRDILS